MKRILLACSAGMSTSLLVTKMQAAAKDQGYEAEIYAVSISEVMLEVEKNPVDILLLGPQVRYLEEEYKNSEKLKGTPIAVINMMDYGMMRGDKVLEAVKEIIG